QTSAAPCSWPPSLHLSPREERGETPSTPQRAPRGEKIGGTGGDPQHRALWPPFSRERATCGAAATPIGAESLRSLADRPRGLWRRLGTSTGVGNAPDRSAGVVGHQQRSVLGDYKRGRTAPDLGAPLAGHPEAGGKILIIAFGAAVLE